MNSGLKAIHDLLTEIEVPGPVHQISRPETAWSVGNAGEVTPGVQKPLSWSYWVNTAELGMRLGWYEEGVLTKRESVMPSNLKDGSEYYLGVFYGRAAINVDRMRVNFDRRPGISGDDFEKLILGGLRPGVSSRKTKSRYPFLFARRPIMLLTIAQRIDNAAATSAKWWQSSVAAAPTLDYDQAAALYWDAFDWSVRVSQPYVLAASSLSGDYAKIAKLTHQVGLAGLEQKLAGGSGGGHDIEIVSDLWEISRGRGALNEFLKVHGYHGPAEGDLSSRSWREDPRPLERLLQSMTSMREDEAPGLREQERIDVRRTAVDTLLDALSWHQRLPAKLLLDRVSKMARLRNIGKSTIMRCMDAGRAASRRIGIILAERGLLADPDDVYFLTAEDLFPAVIPGAREIVAERRQLHDLYEHFELPDHWIGNPVLNPLESTIALKPGEMIKGVGVSAGIVEGRVRVVIDPASSEQLNPGEILVCRTTDPSWGAYFLVAGGLVIDIGGPASHGAVIARELGVPCVISTKHGTSKLCDGDIVRVDGSSGTVELLRRT